MNSAFLYVLRFDLTAIYTSTCFQSTNLYRMKGTSSSSLIFLIRRSESSSPTLESLRSKFLNFLSAGRSMPLGAHYSMSDRSDLIWALRMEIYFFFIFYDFLRLLTLFKLSASFLAKFSRSYLRIAS